MYIEYCDTTLHMY